MRTKVCSAFQIMSNAGILSATNSIANIAPLTMITHQCVRISSPTGSSTQCARASRPSVSSVAYTLRPAAKLAAMMRAAIVAGVKASIILFLVLAIRGVLLAVYHDPAIVCAAMRGAMHVMNAGDEMTARWKKCLSIGIYLRVGRSRDYAIEIVVGHHFHQTRVSVRKGDPQRQGMLAFLRSSALRARRTRRDAANHYIVDRVRWRGTEQLAQLLINLRRA